MNDYPIMTESEKKDIILRFLIYDEDGNEDIKRGFFHNQYVSTIVGDKRMHDAEIDYLLESLHRDNLISLNESTFGYSHEAKEFIEGGGYVEYEKRKEQEKKQIERTRQIERQKLLNEARLAKWQSKTFWPLFIIALVGGLSGIISLLLQIFSN